jgi:outer membrane protein OmpA-like peptidoglycan-associated protein
MKLTGLMAGAMALSLLGTGCATKKYVGKTVAPIEQRVTGTEGKNTEQDTQIASQGKQIEDTDRDLSRTKEKLSDTDAKANQAAEAARVADQKAGTAQQAANGAQQSAEEARNFASQGMTRLDQQMGAMNKFQMMKSDSVLFAVNSDKLTPDAKTQLEELSKQISGLDRYVIEVQGFTDKTGPASYNESLSERRAQTVARFLANQYQIPVRNISMLGSGYAQPVADDKTRDGRKMNRRVEVRLWVPESAASKTMASSGGE